LILIFNKL